MKLLRNILICCALAAATAQVSLATMWTTAGFVFCDSNQNGQIDSGDTPMPGVLVVITNVSGTYSNADFTTTPDGGFIIQLPAVPDTYVEYLHPLTLPADATTSGAYTFTLTAGNSNFVGSFLVHSLTCTNGSPPPPPLTEGTSNAAHDRRPPR